MLTMDPKDRQLLRWHGVKSTGEGIAVVAPDVLRPLDRGFVRGYVAAADGHVSHDDKYNAWATKWFNKA